MTIGELKPNQRFRKWDGRTGKIVHVNPCRARIRLDATPKQQLVAFETDEGNVVMFRRETVGEYDIAPGTEILEVL